MVGGGRPPLRRGGFEARKQEQEDRNRMREKGSVKKEVGGNFRRLLREQQVSPAVRSSMDATMDYVKESSVSQDWVDLHYLDGDRPNLQDGSGGILLGDASAEVSLASSGLVQDTLLVNVSLSDRSSVDPGLSRSGIVSNVAFSPAALEVLDEMSEGLCLVGRDIDLLEGEDKGGMDLDPVHSTLDMPSTVHVNNFLPLHGSVLSVNSDVEIAAHSSGRDPGQASGCWEGSARGTFMETVEEPNKGSGFHLGLKCPAPSEGEFQFAGAVNAGVRQARVQALGQPPSAPEKAEVDPGVTSKLDESFPGQGTGNNMGVWMKPEPIRVTRPFGKQEISVDGVSVHLNELLVDSNIATLHQAIAGKLLGKRIPFPILKAELSRRWASIGKFQLILLENNCFLSIFESQGARDRILSEGPWVVSGSIIGLDVWTEDFLRSIITILNLQFGFTLLNFP